MDTTLDVPGPSPEVEAQRRAQLRRYKAIATGLLLFATAVYFYCRWLEQSDPAPWVGFVRAAAEAGMIGGLADWFAVTALFRRPLGLPIPHTAIVKNKKDQIGESLSGFVGENFLNAELVTQKIRSADLPAKAGSWLSNEDNAQKVSSEIGSLTANILRAIDPQDAEAVIKHSLIEPLAAPEWGPPAGRMLEQLIDSGRTEPIIDEVFAWAHRKAIGAEEFITLILDERRPTWAPKILNEVVGQKVHSELVKFTHAMSTDPNHEARRAARTFLNNFAADLQNDPAMIERVEKLKADILSAPQVAAIPAQLWARTSTMLADAAEDPTSLIRTKIADAAHNWGTRLATDPVLQQRVDERITRAAAFLADNYADDISSIISETIERWDADEASEKIELMVGKDLQYIRLNGTVVGALAGLLIYSVSHVIF